MTKALLKHLFVVCGPDKLILHAYLWGLKMNLKLIFYTLKKSSCLTACFVHLARKARTVHASLW